MGRPEVAEKCIKSVTQDGGHRRLRLPDPGVSGGGWSGNFTGRFVWWRQSGWPESPPTAET